MFGIPGSTLVFKVDAHVNLPVDTVLSVILEVKLEGDLNSLQLP
jgi:hypothetical protein